MLNRLLLSLLTLFIGTCGTFLPINSPAQVQGGNGVRPPSGQGSQVILYSGIKYTGRSKSFNPGSFGVAALGLGLARNVSSVYIPRGFYLTATARDGRQYTFTQSNSMLSSIGWDNILASGVIGQGNPGGNGGRPPGGGTGGGSGGNGQVAATLYYALDFTGQALTYRAGSFNRLAGDAATNITGIYLAPGYAARVYDQPNLRGRSQTFTTSVGDLRRYNWNDRVASLTVYRIGQPAGAGFGRP